MRRACDRTSWAVFAAEWKARRRSSSMTSDTKERSSSTPWSDRKELSSGVHAARVRSDFLGGVRSGVEGAPTIFINDERYQGTFEFDALVGALLKVSRGGSALGPADPSPDLRGRRT